MLTFEQRGLNAPSGAGCFLTVHGLGIGGIILSLNAPSGAGCFLTPDYAQQAIINQVLMHLLVSGAF